MKYSNNSNGDNNYSHTALFCEQVQQLTAMYEQWNDCERTVVLYALLKRLPFSNLKFLQLSIDYNLAQNYNSKHKLNIVEDAANSTVFLNKLVQKYNNLISLTSSNDKIDANSDIEALLTGCSGDSTDESNGKKALDIKSLQDELVGKYNSKEEILHHLLVYLPLLKPGNEDVKNIYIQLLPVIIEDSIKNNLPIELVQQMMSYLLIHPAITFDDRKALTQWLRQLEEHISSSYMQQSQSTSNSYALLPNDNASSFLSTASSISSASSSSSVSSWPTAIPQSSLPNQSISVTGAAISKVFKTKRDQELWDLRNIQVTQGFCDDLISQTKYPMPIGSNKNTSQNSLNSSKPATTLNVNNVNNTVSTSLFETNDEHHISFSKNGTEIVDYDTEEFIGENNGNNKGLHIQPPVPVTNTPTVPVKSSSANTSEFLAVPQLFNDHLFDVLGGYGYCDGFSDDDKDIKTRRSNSLTTPSACGGELLSSSAENLLNLQKPRSYSLSIESTRNNLMSSGSETRLDDYNKLSAHNKYNNNSNHAGMGNIGQWLKSLRLHKYFWLFTNMSYEQMMDISEEYLENLGVTKGARHKLVLCIQKLGDRVKTLQQIEKDLIDGTRTLKSALDELTNIVLTPMKPMKMMPKDDDVALQFMRVLDCSFHMLMNVKFLSQHEEEAINSFMWLVDKALHNDAFLQQLNHLKEYKFKLSKVKSSYGHKIHYNKLAIANCTGNANKLRWNNSKSFTKTGNTSNNNSINSSTSSTISVNNSSNGCNSDNQQKIQRKNSMQYYTASQLYPYNNGGNSNVNTNNNNNKSSSYPNFQMASNMCGNVNNTGSQNIQQTSNMTTNNFQRSSSREKLNQFTMMQQQQQQHQQQQHHQQFNQQMQQNHGPMPPPYHRHSLNNLMPLQQHQSLALQQHQQQQQQYRRNSSNSCGSERVMSSSSMKSLSSPNGSIGGSLGLSSHEVSSGSVATMSPHLTVSNPSPTASDINSRLESLCRQMTEQAIN